jgi:hypothetical protein
VGELVKRVCRVERVGVGVGDQEVARPLSRLYTAR